MTKDPGSSDIGWVPKKIAGFEVFSTMDPAKLVSSQADTCHVWRYSGQIDDKYGGKEELSHFFHCCYYTSVPIRMGG